MLLRILTVVALGTLVALTALRASHAEEAVAVLIPEITVDGDVVTIGDLFGISGPLADTPVFRAPQPGMRGAVPVADVVAAVAPHGLTEVETGGLAYVTVGRSGRRVTAEDIQSLLLSELLAVGVIQTPDAVTITFDSPPADLFVDAYAARRMAVAIERIDAATGRFRAMLRVGPASQPVPLGGRFIETVDAVTLTRPIERGQHIGARDVAVQRVNRAEMPRNAVVDPAEIVGSAARRGLRAGTPVRFDDLMEPVLVERNQDVTLVYRSAGITLSARGRALADAGRGETVAVVNTQSRRTVQGRVTDYGIVEISPNAGLSARGIGRGPTARATTRTAAAL